MGPKALILIGPVTLSEIQGFDKAPGVTTGPNTSPRGPLGLWSIGPINNRVHVACAHGAHRVPFLGPIGPLGHEPKRLHGMLTMKCCVECSTLHVTGPFRVLGVATTSCSWRGGRGGGVGWVGWRGGGWWEGLSLNGCGALCNSKLFGPYKGSLAMRAPY
jgi:hypothetical protein